MGTKVGCLRADGAQITKRSSAPPTRKTVYALGGAAGEIQMKVFVTGVNGYIGAVLGPYLMERGLSVVGLDTGYYRDGWLFSDNKRMRFQPHTINKDLRDIAAADLEGCDAVAHLAELSNDPLGQNNPQVTH